LAESALQKRHQHGDPINGNSLEHLILNQENHSFKYFGRQIIMLLEKENLVFKSGLNKIVQVSMYLVQHERRSSNLKSVSQYIIHTLEASTMSIVININKCKSVTVLLWKVFMFQIRQYTTLKLFMYVINFIGVYILWNKTQDQPSPTILVTFWILRTSSINLWLKAEYMLLK
jgi:hypothetical protein